ncbi:MAG: hypothetical protein ABJF01_00110 [bacterium]
MRILILAVSALAASAVAACTGDSSSPPPPETLTPASCPGINLGARPAPLSISTPTPTVLHVFGNGPDTLRYTAEIAVRGTTAYTTTWNVRRVQGNKVNIWDVSGNVPLLVDSLILSGAITTDDVALSDDGKLLVVATEPAPGSIGIFDLADPRHPVLLTRFTNDQTMPGIHTVKLGRVNGKLYGFLSVDPVGDVKARLVIVDLSTPSAPKQVFVKIAGSPYVHDTFPRDGLLFVALWNDGMDIWDIGGCGTGATPENPRQIGNVKTLGGEVHNIWWYHDPAGSKRFAFVGEEGSGSIGSSSRGDIHVVDVSDPTAPKEVAFYNVPGAGTHNFSVDESDGVLYAAYYNGGVRALDIRGDLASCSASQKKTDPATNLSRCDLRLMGREIGVGLTDVGRSVYVWGVQYVNGTVYASDMLNGIWKLGAAK